VVALAVVMVLAVTLMVFARSVRVEAIASGNASAALQADFAERGAEQYLMYRVDGSPGSTLAQTDLPTQAVQLGDCAYWLLSPDYENPGEYVFDVSDEAAKLNLNTATAEMLARLPNMTAELAAAIVDWRDADSDISPDGGAEDDYYLALDNPYHCKNGPFETVEELLMVKGITPDLVYGTAQSSAGDAFGQNARGLIDYVTVYSAEPNRDAAGEARIDVNNGGSFQQLPALLRESLSADRVEIVSLLARTRRPFLNIVDFYYRTTMTSQEFGSIADRITTGRQQTVRGLINVNTAPREVLLCLPGLDENDVAKITAARESAPDLSSIAWVADALAPPGDVPAQLKAVGIGGLITTHSYQTSAQVLAITGDGRSFRRVRVVLDAAGGSARIVYRRDLTALGWPLDPQILVDARHGRLAQWTSGGGSSAFQSGGAIGGGAAGTIGGTR
jgi:type II secretory pathway component PulK